MEYSRDEQGLNHNLNESDKWEENEKENELQLIV
jgi:hypothetical protein